MDGPLLKMCSYYITDNLQLLHSDLPVFKWDYLLELASKARQTFKAYGGVSVLLHSIKEQWNAAPAQASRGSGMKICEICVCMLKYAYQH